MPTFVGMTSGENMNTNDIRKAFLNYMESNGHKIVPSASLIPDDPSLLFTVAGVVPFKKVLQGAQPAPAPRVADSQKCLRAGGKHNDLEDVGYDSRHQTFFEMLGNWSFGDYFKEGAIELSWNLLTRELGIDPARLVVTTHTSDEEATAIWKKLTGKSAIRLDKDNWWSMGDTGPCGPSTEIFYDHGADVPGGLPGSPDEDAGRYIEIWNNVFMQFDKGADGKLSPLPKQNVDTGGGLERWAAMLQGVHDNFDTDTFVALKSAVSDVVGVAQSRDNIPQFKIIADHLRAVGFAIADGVQPSNIERGYVIRRILRRAMRQGHALGHKGPLLSRLYPALAQQMGAAYPELIKEQNRVIETIEKEENSFADMLVQGMKLLEKEIAALPSKVMPGATAFKMYDTYGFPLDMTEQILRERGVAVDVPGFDAAMAEQKERSRSTQVFKGGLSGTGEMETKYHTAAHLLHAALRKVFGDGAVCKGSNITPERLRFDFSLDRRMEPSEISEVERIVNEAIAAAADVVLEEMPLAAAQASGAIGLFSSKYGDVVKVYTMGEYSKEICGGPHARNTSELGSFKIQKEESSGAGVRRIKAVIN
ncbi:MAG: alanine--tRNA ligase [Rickettsiales bacterium]|jgi:alanyl-tRNA synthetase|nr:alanine--tRNA ligase [Rickettsiales bacterium]